MENLTRTDDDERTLELLGIIVNLRTTHVEQIKVAKLACLTTSTSTITNTNI